MFKDNKHLFKDVECPFTTGCAKPYCPFLHKGKDILNFCI